MPSIYAEKKEGTEFAQVEPGTYVARCYSMIDLGTQETEFKGEKKKEYIEAIHAGLDSDYRPMEKVFTWVIQQTLPHHG
jgi:hypothetical protein